MKATRMGVARVAQEEPQIPADLLLAVSELTGAGLVIVMGAGCSSAAPTSLPLAAELAQEIHSRLVDDHVLEQGDVAEPRNLSMLTDIIFAKTRSQDPVVRRFPVPRFRTAAPNQGYLIVAALLREGVVKIALTVNFDLAMSNALAELSGDDVNIVPGPDQHHLFGSPCVVYLHRNVDADPDELILRSSELDTAWQGAWRQAVVSAIAPLPNILFAGLGTPSLLFSQSIEKIKDALPSGVHIYLADIAPFEDSPFAAALGIMKTNYIRGSWNATLKELGQRTLKAQMDCLGAAVRKICDEHGYETEKIDALLTRIAKLGLVDMGKVRALWLLSDRRYEPDSDPYRKLLADLIVGIAVVERETLGEAYVDQGGLVWIRTDTKLCGPIIVASGCGFHKWLALEPILMERRRQMSIGALSGIALISNISGGRPTIGPPTNLVRDPDTTRDDLVKGPTAFEIITVDELYADPSLSRRIAS